MLVYFAVMLVGMSVYGVDAWVRNADAFGVLFSLLGARGRGAAEAGVAGTMLLLIVAIGSTAFDGAREASGFATVADAFAGMGTTGGRIAGLALCVALAVAIWAAGLGADPQARPRLHAHADPDRRGLSGGALLLAGRRRRPGAVAAGQRPARRRQGPVRRRRGGGGLRRAGATAIWWVQIVALVLGHVAALVLAHDRALEVYGDARAAARSQVTMLGLMVVFTCTGLWLLSSGFNA